jgi:ParB family chromosome partitioning protein
MQEEALLALSQSILKQGVMQPIIVRPVGNNQYEIIAGERRWRAAKLANLNDVPVIIKNIPDESALAMALIENIQRENLNPLEEAVGIKRLIDEFNMTHEEAADAVGKSRVTVSNLLRLLTLTKPVQDRLLNGKIDMGHARALIGLEGSQQIMLCEEIIQKNLSVREVETLVKNLQNGYKTGSSPSSPKKTNADVRQLEESLAEALGASVTIDAKKNGSGILKVHYRNLEQLDEILKKIKR